MTNIDPRDFNRAFEGLEFPTSKDGVLRTAADKGGINGDVLRVLEGIPDRTYDDNDDLMHAIDAAYLEIQGITEGLVEPTPAAPADPQAKDVAAAGAETEDHSAA